jgi:hypothetical protein
LSIELWNFRSPETSSSSCFSCSTFNMRHRCCCPWPLAFRLCIPPIPGPGCAQTRKLCDKIIWKWAIAMRLYNNWGLREMLRPKSLFLAVRFHLQSNKHLKRLWTVSSLEFFAHHWTKEVASLAL